MPNNEQCPIELKRSKIEGEHNEGCDEIEDMEAIFKGHLKFGDSVRSIARVYNLNYPALKQWLIKKQIIKADLRKVVCRNNLSSQAIYGRRKLGIPLHIRPMTRSERGTLGALSRRNPQAAREYRSKLYKGTI